MTENLMRKISIEKLTLNCGCGTDYNRLEKSIKLLKKISGKSPIKTQTEHRIPNWGLRKGLHVGTKVTLRGEQIHKIIIQLLGAKDKLLDQNSFDDNGNVAFGIHEYIDIPGIEYDPEIGIIGMQATITLQRPGFRVKKRQYLARKIPTKHRISKKDAIAFAKENWGIKIKQEEEVVE